MLSDQYRLNYDSVSKVQPKQAIIGQFPLHLTGPVRWEQQPIRDCLCYALDAIDSTAIIQVPACA